MEFNRLSKLLVMVILVLSIALYLSLRQGRSEVGGEDTSAQQATKKYPLLSTRVLQEYHNDILINFLPLRNQIRTMTEPWREDFALYFEYLPTGTSININSGQEFSSESLVKVPVVMAYYRFKERTGFDGKTQATIQAENIDNRFGDLWRRGEGAKIPLDEVAELAITDSDNTAILTLENYFPAEDFPPVYDGLDIDLRITPRGTTIMTAKHFTSILKALYFSSVLSKDSSEEILELMTRTKFQDKLPAGVPKDVKVAHKIGVGNGDLYMDCGIVYVPKRPYTLCMISATDESTARSRMIQVSKTVYDFVSTVN